MLKKRLISIVLIWCIASIALTSVNASEKYGTDTAEETAALMAEVLVNYYGVSSLQYALIDNGEITISGTAVSPVFINETEAITNGTMYGIGSVSKIYTTASVMKLVDDGKIILDNPVTHYIPEFKMKDERYKDITVRMLLNHSSGLHGSKYSDAFVFDTYDAGVHNTLLDYLADQNLKAAPGEIAVYCNDGFTLAEIVVERVSGTSFSEYLQENILSALNIENTKTPANDFDRNILAATYDSNGKKTPADTLNIIGTGGIYSTASDAVMFAQTFMDDSNNLLSKDSVDAMAQYEFENGIWPEMSDNILDYGLGWDSVRLFPFNRYDIQALTKGGDTLLYHTSLVVLPEYNMAMAVLMAGGASTYGTTMASNVLLDLLFEQGKIEIILPNADFGIKAKPTDIPEEYEEYCGYYISSNGVAQINKNKENNGIEIISPYAPNQGITYFYCGDGTFIYEELNSVIQFVKEENGNIYLWERTYTELPYLGQMATSMYVLQKAELDSVDEAVAQSWVERNGKIYFLVSENYNSQAYSVGSASMLGATIMYSEEFDNYVMQNKIADENLAVSAVQIPGIAGRDTTDYVFYEENGVEYLAAASLTFADASIFTDIHAGKTSYATINSKGESKWYYTGVAAGRTMLVNMPENASFAVYDQNFTCTFYSYTEKSNEVLLPENGTIVFIGEEGARFDITLK